MTVATSNSRDAYNCSGGTTYDFHFGVGATSEVKVVLTDAFSVETILTETTHYTVSATNSDFSSGGTVTTVSAYAAPNKITILRNVPLTQESDFTEGMPTLYETFESGLDKLTRIVQQHNEIIVRSLTLPLSSASISALLPVPVANAYLAINSAGTAFEMRSLVAQGSISDETYDATTWLSATTVAPSKKAVRDVIETKTAKATAAEITTGTEAAKAIAPDQLKLAGIVPSNISNLYLAVNAAVNKLDIFARSNAAVPDATNVIRVDIPDGNGVVTRSRAAAYLSGTSQFIMADAANYWSKGSLDAEIKTAYVYAIWDANGGIVWALGGYAGFTRCPASTTTTDDDFFLLEESSTYTKVITDYCVCVGKIRYQYDTADTPDHTIQATVLDAPQVIWNPKSDYGYTKSLATTVTSAGDIAEYSAVSLVVKQSGKYSIALQSAGYFAAGTIKLFLKTGSSTYASATLKGEQDSAFNVTGNLPAGVKRKVYLNTEDTIHLGASVEAGGGNRYLFGDNTYLNVTNITFERCD